MGVKGLECHLRNIADHEKKLSMIVETKKLSYE